MSPWNRLRNLAGRLLAGDDGRANVDDAIYLTETAYRNHQPGPAKAPEIRERHFGADLRRERTVGDAPAQPRRGLLARMGLRRRSPAGRHEPDYAGTTILGTPHPAPRPEIPARGATESPPAKSPERTTMPATPSAPASHPAPLAASPAAPLTAPMPATVPVLAGDPPVPAVRKAVPDAAPPPPSDADDAEMLRHLFGEPEPAQPQRPSPAPAAAPAPRATGKDAPVAAQKKKKMDRGDLTIAALGVTLAAICAVFPWYIFFNQEKFGVREFVFSGGGSGRPPAGISYQPQALGKPFSRAEAPKMELDFFPTATLPSSQASPQAVPVSQQPFPADRVNFRLVHVANGRAMIEDSDGLWVVQRGSLLPDASRVASIEQREGRWVLVTTNDRTVEIGAN